MGIYKSLPEPIKKYLKKKLRVPTNFYQNVHTDIKITNYHKDRFNEYHNKFCQSDVHLNFDNNVTRFRNYNVYKFGELAIKNNPSGCFLSAGISYGTSAKVLTHLLDSLASGNKYYLIDPYENIGNLN